MCRERCSHRIVLSIKNFFLHYFYGLTFKKKLKLCSPEVTQTCILAAWVKLEDIEWREEASAVLVQAGFAALSCGEI